MPAGCAGLLPPHLPLPKFSATAAVGSPRGPPTTVPTVDIEEFYDEDERRRSSAELEFGGEWRDKFKVRYELNWVEDTGELYVMREPVPHEWADPFGGIHVSGSHREDETEVEAMTVSVVATVADRAELERILAGWEDAMGGSDSVGWLVAGLRSAGLLGPDGPSSPLST